MSTIKRVPGGVAKAEALPANGNGAKGTRATTTTACVIMGHGRAGFTLADALRDYGISARAGLATGEGLQAISDENPEVILVGRDTGSLELPRAVGLARESAPGARILVLIDAVDLNKAREAVDAGADDVVTPPHAAHHVVLRISMALNRSRQTMVGPPPATNGHPPAHPSQDPGLEVADAERALILNGHKIQLAPRELDLLRILDRARGSVVSREALLSEIWGKELDDDAVLDATIHRLRRKIEEVVPASRILVTVRGIGYRLETPPS